MQKGRLIAGLWTEVLSLTKVAFSNEFPLKKATFCCVYFAAANRFATSSQLITFQNAAT